MVWPEGKKLNGDRYTIQKVLGQGRFGITYLARESNNNPVVLKTPNDESLNDPDFARLQQVFVQEAVKLAQCKHPHIVRAEQPFQEDGIWCLVMEYIDGTDLGSRSRSQLPEAEALQYIQQIGEALIEVHKNNLLHRDLRPENIMVRAGKAEAVLIDFGLAMEFDRELTKTRSEEIMKGFAPLELYARSQPRGPYTDIYALGATLYVLLTGQIPTDAPQRKVSGVPLRSPKDLNPQISDRVNNAILHAMKLEAHQRPQSVAEWLNELGLAVSASPPPPPAPLTPPPPPPPPRQTNWTVVWAGVAAIAALVGAIGSLLSGIGIPQLIDRGNKQPPSPPAQISPSPSPTPKASSSK